MSFPRPIPRLRSLRPSTLTTRSQTWLAVLLGGLTLAGCGQESKIVPGLGTPGESLNDPLSDRDIFVDPSEGGGEQQLRISNVFYGRLVRVFALLGNNFDGSPNVNGPRIEMREDFLIGANNIGGNDKWAIETNPASGEESLVIFQNLDPDLGVNPNFASNKAEFNSILYALGQSVEPVFDAGIGGAGVFTMLPRNAGLMIQFNDLLDASSVNEETIRVSTGIPSIVPYEARIILDPNYGDVIDFDGDGVKEFHSTRVVLDMAVNEIESFISDPPLPVNNIGLPPSLDSNLSNVQVRIPTALAPLFGQAQLLRNLSQHTLSENGNGSVDFNRPTRDVVRAVRSGGRQGVTGDPYNGYLRDETPPRVVAGLTASISGSVSPDPGGDPSVFLISEIDFDSDFCAQAPDRGDLIQQLSPNVIAQVEVPGVQPNQGKVTNVLVRLLAFPSEWETPMEWLASAQGPIQYITAYDPLVDINNRACFLRTFPESVNPNNQIPGQDILNSSSLGVRFSEPMDTDSITAFDSLVLTRVDPTTVEAVSSFDVVVGSISQTLNLRDFSFVPDLPLLHEQGANESYFLSIIANEAGAPTDLAGNPIQTSPGSSTTGPLTATIAAEAPEALNGGRVSRFSGADEEPPFAEPEDDPFAEWSGQHVYNIEAGSIRPRPVVRSLGLADSSNDLIGAMSANPAGGLTEPLNRFGSKTQMIWRYTDVGIDLLDTATGKLVPDFLNIDIEGLNWAPLGGQVVVDTYNKFEMRMSHSIFLPDEVLTPPPVMPAFPQSGLVEIFENNLLDENADPQKVVHDRNEGYLVSPGDVFTAGQGTRLIPFPLNTSEDVSTHRFFTWRDTAVQARGGPNGIGAPFAQWHVVTGTAFPVTVDDMGMCVVPIPQFFPVSDVPTAGMPLMTEFLCFPDDAANGVNQFDVSLAITNTISTRPFFRAFSAGGINSDQNPILVDPDLESSANGGFNPLSIPIAGSPTFGLDNNVYIGAMDFVVRVSRSYSVWWPIEPNVGSIFTSSAFFPPTIEPSPTAQPQGTAVEYAVRGASSIADPSDPVMAGDIGSDLRAIATRLDPYGDYYADGDDPCHGPGPNPYPAFVHAAALANPGVGFIPTIGNGWFEDVSAINGSNYYQVRISFLSNTQTGLVPELSAFGMTWSNN